MRYARPVQPPPPVEPDFRSRLLALTAPIVLCPVGLLVWIGTLLIGVNVADLLPVIGLGLISVAFAFPTACRLIALSSQSRWVLLVGVISIPAGVVGGLAAMFTMVFWDAGLLSGPPPTDRAFRSMTLGYLAMAAPVTIGQAAIESFGVGAATQWQTGAGLTAVSMGFSWLVASTLIVAGFAWDVQASAAWAPWLACDLAIAVTLFGPVPGTVIGRTLARFRSRRI